MDQIIEVSLKSHSWFLTPHFKYFLEQGKG